MELSGKVVNINFFIESLLNLHWPMKCILVWVELHMDTTGSLLQEQG